MWFYSFLSLSAIAPNFLSNRAYHTVPNLLRHGLQLHLSFSFSPNIFPSVYGCTLLLLPVWNPHHLLPRRSVEGIDGVVCFGCSGGLDFLNNTTNKFAMAASEFGYGCPVISRPAPEFGIITGGACTEKCHRQGQPHSPTKATSISGIAPGCSPAIFHHPTLELAQQSSPIPLAVVMDRLSKYRLICPAS